MGPKKDRAYALPLKKASDRKEKVRPVKGKYLCIITGAGHGIGRAIASLAFQDQGILPDAWKHSKLCLIDIDEEALNDTAGKKMRQFLAHREIDVDLITFDFSDIHGIQEMMEQITTKYDKDFERVILVNAAHSIGTVSNLLTLSENPVDIQRFWDLNITSKIVMTNQICLNFTVQKKMVVDITSQDLSVPTKTLGLACMASSAMSMFDEVFAQENPNVAVLHYVTDRLDTNIVTRIIEETNNTALANELEALKVGHKLTPTLDAAKRMIKNFDTGNFVKGKVTHVDAKAEIENEGPPLSAPASPCPPRQM